jgi:hypothetical protein
MKTKILIATGLLAAFIMGTVANSFYQGSSAANAPAEQSVIAPANASRPIAAARTQYVAPRRAVVERAQPVAAVAQEKKRSLKNSALIIGGSAGAGAAIGAVAGGKKGAAVGAVSGGVAGLVYDLATRNK